MKYIINYISLRFINHNFSHVHQITCVNLLHAKGNIVNDI